MAHGAVAQVASPRMQVNGLAACSPAACLLQSLAITLDCCGLGVRRLQSCFH